MFNILTPVSRPPADESPADRVGCHSLSAAAEGSVSPPPLEPPPPPL
eukprot:SAG22_NODE_17948_length_296_cov_0.629442_1_plen_46_part_01